MNKKYIWSIVILVVIIIILVASFGEKSSNSSIKIGAIAPLTGWGAYWGEGYTKGIEMAVAEINSSGDKVKVIIEDGATDGVKSATAAQKLINIDGVRGLIVEFTAPASAVSPIALQKGIPLMYDAVTKKIVESNQLAFKMYFDMENQCRVAADYLARHGSKHIGMLSINLDFAEECQSAIEKVSVQTGVKSSFYLFPGDTSDFRTYISKMKTDGVDAIVPVPFEDNAIAFFKQKADLKFDVPVFLGLGVPDAFSIKVRTSVATSSIEGVITYDQAISDGFKSALVARYPGITEKDFLSAAYGYDETMRLYRSLSSCADLECVISKMKSDTYSGALMAKGFDDSRVINVDPIYYRYTGGKLVSFDPSK